MVIVKLNQGRHGLHSTSDAMLRFSLSRLAYIISIGINQKPEMLVGATSKIGEYLKNCGY